MGIFGNDGGGFASEIELGKRYIDKQTGIEGVVVVVSFFQFGCERVTLEVVREGEIKEYSFDAPRLTEVGKEEPVKSDKSGGPERGTSHVRQSAVQRSVLVRAPASRGGAT